MILDQLNSDLTAALKSHDRVAAATLRISLTRIKEAEVAGTSARTLSDDEVIAVLRRQVKECDEAIEAFTDGGRPERAAEEAAQRAVLERYLPAALTNDEVEEIVAAEVAAGGFTSMKDMGSAMKAVKAKVDGRADGKYVAALVKAALGS